jgi:4-hydroxy-tetrahydrodipicolinate reductase
LNAASSSASRLIRVAVAGASGRMGRMLIDAVHHAEDMTLSAALDRADTTAIGSIARGDETPGDAIRITADIAAALANSDVLIDFTRPEGTLAHVAACATHGVAMVIGTTGFDPAGRTAIETAAQRIPIVFAPNMSIGVNVLFKLIGDAAHALASGYDIEIVEAHHRHKVDAPSGTALALGRIVADATGRSFDAVATYDRHGHTGARRSDAIGFSAIRGGDIVGDHTVLFAGAGERIEITHRSTSRAGYAQGALIAARFLANREHGLFDMQDVLGLR